LLTDINVVGPVKAKMPGAIDGAGARALLPQPKLLEILESCVRARMCPVINAKLEADGLDAMLLAGLRSAQPMDVEQSIQLVVEIGLDHDSQRAIAQADVRAYYDQISSMPLLAGLIDVGVDAEVARATLRLHFCPQIWLSMGECRAAIVNRTRGLMTGSSAASLLVLHSEEALMLHPVPLTETAFHCYAIKVTTSRTPHGNRAWQWQLGLTTSSPSAPCLAAPWRICVHCKQL
jgi:hypothetical protein